MRSHSVLTIRTISSVGSIGSVCTIGSVNSLCFYTRIGSSDKPIAVSSHMRSRSVLTIRTVGSVSSICTVCTVFAIRTVGSIVTLLALLAFPRLSAIYAVNQPISVFTHSNYRSCLSGNTIRTIGNVKCLTISHCNGNAIGIGSNTFYPLATIQQSLNSINGFFICIDLFL